MIYHGSKDVAAAGTAEALSATGIIADWVQVQAKSANTGLIFTGGTGVSSSAGVRLYADDGFMYPPKANNAMYDLQHIYIDAAVNGEGVTFTYGRG